MVLVLGESEVSSFSLRDIMSMIKFLFYFQVQMYFLITNCFMFVWEISSIHRQTTRYMYHNYNKALVCKISDTRTIKYGTLKYIFHFKYPMPTSTCRNKKDWKEKKNFSNGKPLSSKDF